MSNGFGRINDLCHDAHENAVKKGFWEDNDPTDVRHVLAMLMLITTEVAEAAEAARKPDFGNLPEELADVCIRVFDLSGAMGINLEQEIVDKMATNLARPRKHGKLA